jgi:protein SCO1
MNPSRTSPSAPAASSSAGRSVSALAGSAPEQDIAALVDAVRAAPERRDDLLALLPERAPLYAGRTSAEVTRLRGYTLAAFAETGLPAPALPYVLEALESGHMPYEIAAAAIAVRGLADPPAELVTYLLRALDNLTGIDATVSFEGYDPRWPFAEPTTAVTEVLRTLGGLGQSGVDALPELERRCAQRDRHPPAVLAELEAAVRAIRSAAPAAHECCHAMPTGGAVEAAAPSGDLSDVTLEDQDGRAESYAAFFSVKPSVVAFFYTRCDSPYKCSLMVAKLARVQAMIRERGRSGAVRLAAITYDPEFDTPKRMLRYGRDRGFEFGDDARFFRATDGFDALVRHFSLGVNYGPSTVNRHQIEAHVLDADGDPVASFTRLQWEPEELVAAVTARSRG